MKIGCVGCFGSNFDMKIIYQAAHLLKIREFKIDLIDLRYQRDFLKEKHEYDVVLLNYIFILSPSEFKEDPGYSYTKNNPEFKTSDVHTPENWRERLIETKAKEILIFGYSLHSEITGEYLKDIDGYTMISILQKFGNIWRYTLN